MKLVEIIKVLNAINCSSDVNKKVNEAKKLVKSLDQSNYMEKSIAHFLGGYIASKPSDIKNFSEWSNSLSYFTEGLFAATGMTPGEFNECFR